MEKFKSTQRGHGRDLLYGVSWVKLLHGISSMVRPPQQPASVGRLGDETVIPGRRAVLSVKACRQNATDSMP